MLHTAEKFWENCFLDRSTFSLIADYAIILVRCFTAVSICMCVSSWPHTYSGACKYSFMEFSRSKFFGILNWCTVPQRSHQHFTLHYFLLGNQTHIVRGHLSDDISAFTLWTCEYVVYKRINQILCDTHIIKSCIATIWFLQRKRILILFCGRSYLCIWAMIYWCGSFQVRACVFFLWASIAILDFEFLFTFI